MADDSFHGADLFDGRVPVCGIVDGGLEDEEVGGAFGEDVTFESEGVWGGAEGADAGINKLEGAFGESFGEVLLDEVAPSFHGGDGAAEECDAQGSVLAGFFEEVWEAATEGVVVVTEGGVAVFEFGGGSSWNSEGVAEGVGDGVRVAEAVGVVIGVGAFEEGETATKLGVALLNEEDIFLRGDYVVRAAAEADDVDAGVCEGFQVVDGIARESEGFRFIGESVRGEKALPVCGGAFSGALAAGPAFEIADGVVTVDGGDFFGIPCGPVEGEETAAAEPGQRRFFPEAELFCEGCVEAVHGIQGRGGAIEVLNIEVGHVEPAAQQFGVDLGFVSEELGAPVPRVSGERFFGKHE